MGERKNRLDPLEKDRKETCVFEVGNHVTKDTPGFPMVVVESEENWSDSKTIGQSQLSFSLASPVCVWWQGGTDLVCTKESADKQTPKREDLHPKYKRNSRMNPKLALRFILVLFPLDELCHFRIPV